MGAEAKREGAISDVTPLGDTPALVERRALSAVRLGGDPMTVSAVLDAARRARPSLLCPLPPVGGPPPRPCRPTTPVARHATTGSSIPPTRRPWRRSSR